MNAVGKQITEIESPRDVLAKFYSVPSLDFERAGKDKPIKQTVNMHAAMSESTHKCDCGYIASSEEDLAKHMKEVHGK